MSWRPTHNRTSIGMAWEQFVADKTISKFVHFLSSLSKRLPQALFPTGEAEYWRIYDNEGGDLNYKILLWRESFHFIAGAILGLGLPYWLIGISLGGYEGISLENYENLPISLLKPLIDISCWTLGAYTGGLVSWH